MTSLDRGVQCDHALAKTGLRATGEGADMAGKKVRAGAHKSGRTSGAARRRMLATGLVALTASGVAAAPASAGGGGGSTIFACYSNSTDALSYLKPPATTCPSGTTKISWSSTGPQGAQGAAGAQGKAGAAGPQGKAGAAGPQGAAGAQGKAGAAGAKGAQGAAGAKGAQGAQGATGATGPEGPNSVVEDGNIDLNFGSTNTGSAWTFIGDTPDLNIIASNVDITITGTVDWGASNASEIQGYYGVCYQDQTTSGAVTDVQEVLPQITPGANNFVAEPITGVIPAADLTEGDAYLVGVCTTDDSSNVEFGLGAGTWSYTEPEFASQSFASHGAPLEKESSHAAAKPAVQKAP